MVDSGQHRLLDHTDGRAQIRDSIDLQEDTKDGKGEIGVW